MCGNENPIPQGCTETQPREGDWPWCHGDAVAMVSRGRGATTTANVCRRARHAPRSSPRVPIPTGQPLETGHNQCPQQEHETLNQAVPPQQPPKPPQGLGFAGKPRPGDGKREITVLSNATECHYGLSSSCPGRWHLWKERGPEQGSTDTVSLPGDTALPTEGTSPTREEGLQ